MTPMFFIRLSCLNLVVFFSFPRAIVNNFVTERNSAEVMAVGLNAVRWVSTLYISDLGSRIPDLGSRIPDLTTATTKEEVGKICLINGIRKKTYPVSRIRGSKKHRIPDPDPHHCGYHLSPSQSSRILRSPYILYTHNSSTQVPDPAFLLLLYFSRFLPSCQV
jgi:hypothetical protein